ncbi:MAG: YetF domain-containing protein [Betaproteobacteria bacterium]
MIVADAAQNAMAGEYTSVTDGCILVATLMFWNIVVDFLSFRSARFRRFAEPSVLLLIKNGEMQRRNLRREFISPDELMSQLREQGIDKLAQVKRCYMEPSGTISVIKYKDDDDKPEANRKKVAGA